MSQPVPSIMPSALLGNDYTSPPETIQVSISTGEVLALTACRSDHDRFARGWGMMAEMAVDLPFMAGEARNTLLSFDSRQPEHGKFIKTVLLALQQKRLPLGESLLLAVGPCVSGANEEARIAAVQLLGKQGSALNVPWMDAQIGAWLLQLAFEFAGSATCDGSPNVVEQAVIALMNLALEPSVTQILLQRVADRGRRGEFGERSAHVRSCAINAMSHLPKANPDGSPIIIDIAHTHRADGIYGLTCPDREVQQACAALTIESRKVPRPPVNSVEDTTTKPTVVEKI